MGEHDQLNGPAWHDYQAAAAARGSAGHDPINRRAWRARAGLGRPFGHLYHQGVGWMPTSWISSLFPWASFILESWTSKLFYVFFWGVASSVP
jgi:hypothetical protein